MSDAFITIGAAIIRIADALERNTAALEAILQRLAVPTLLPLIESAPEAEMSAAAKSEYWAGYSDGYSYGRTNPAEIDAYLAQSHPAETPYDVGYEIGLMDAKSDGAQ